MFGELTRAYLKRKRALNTLKKKQENIIKCGAREQRFIDARDGGRRARGEGLYMKARKLKDTSDSAFKSWNCSNMDPFLLISFF